MAAPTRGCLAVALCLILPALAPALSAQDPPSQDKFGEQVEVDVVNVDVFVTDRDGLPVPGLDMADFEIREDGQRVEITNFSAVDRGAAPAPPPGADATDPQMPSMSPAAGSAPAADAMQLAAHANTQRVTLYTLQASGLETAAASAAEAGPDDRLLMLGSVASIEAQNRQSSLSVMAADTGGRSIFNANDVRPALAHMRDDFNRYYSLGFKPRHIGDGRQHRIEVRILQRKGLQVRHPLSYRDKPAMERAVDRTLAALVFGSEDNPLGVSLEVGEITPAVRGGYTVPVRLRIPLHKVLFRQTEESSIEGRLRLLVASQSGDGSTSRVRQVQVPVKIPKLALTLERGTQRVAVAVHDEGTAQTSFLARGVRVGGNGGAVRGQF